MLLWRISRFADLEGRGGEFVSGRWHRKGHRIVYCADHPSTALLEMLVHLDPDDIPGNYQLLKIDCPDRLLFGSASRETETSARQREIIDEVLSGASVTELAKKLGISEQTVEWYLSVAERALDEEAAAKLEELMQRALSLRIGEPDFTMDLGTGWLAAGETCLLKVPSAIMPAASNYLLNPLHPDAAQITISDIFEYPFDRRLR